jgi:hypothetical protein
LASSLSWLVSIFSWKESILANFSSIICSICIGWLYSQSLYSSIQFHFWHQLSRVWLTVDRFWIDDRIYWTLWYSAWLPLQFTITHTHTHTVVSTVTSSLTVARYRLPTLDVAFPLVTWTMPGLSYQLLTAAAVL